MHAIAKPKFLVAVIAATMIAGLTPSPAHADRIVEHGERGGRHNDHHQWREAPRDYSYRGLHVRRWHGRPHRGYGYYDSDREAYRFLAFSAFTVALVDHLTWSQQRLYESAQIRATTARPGDVVVWNDDNARGSVKVIRDGTNRTGRPCREFRQDVTIGGRTEQAYGTACLQTDGSWRMTDSR